MSDTTKQWPTEITPAIVATNAHIPDAAIDTDIADTQEEIDRFQRLMGAYEIVVRNHLDRSERQLAEFRLEAYTQEIAVRERFITFLKALQVARSGGQDA
jgi:hypothetical protein